MAVLGRSRDELGSDHTVRAPAILDDELSAESVRELLGKNASHAVVSASGWKGDDHSDGRARVCLGASLTRGTERSDRGDARDEYLECHTVQQSDLQQCARSPEVHGQTCTSSGV